MDWHLENKYSLRWASMRSFWHSPLVFSGGQDFFFNFFLSGLCIHVPFHTWACVVGLQRESSPQVCPLKVYDTIGLHQWLQLPQGWEKTPLDMLTDVLPLEQKDQVLLWMKWCPGTRELSSHAAKNTSIWQTLQKSKFLFFPSLKLWSHKVKNSFSSRSWPFKKETFQLKVRLSL